MQVVPFLFGVHVELSHAMGDLWTLIKNRSLHCMCTYYQY